MSERKKPLGVILKEKGLVSEDQIRIALFEQKRTGQPMGKLLVHLGFVSEATLTDALSETLGQNSVDLSKVVISSDLLKLVSQDVARRTKAIPIGFDTEKKVLTVAMSDTYNIVALDQLRAAVGIGIHIEPMLAGEAEVGQAINHFYGYDLSIDGILHEIETGEIDYASLSVDTDEYSQPVVRLVDALLADAVQRGASDIHFEPEANFLRIRYRIDGVLRQIRALHKKYWPGVLVRLKVISGMNIAETRAPQDGRISLNLTGRQVDFRVAAQPTTHGENVVLRVLDRSKSLVPLEKLGLPEENLSLLKLMLARPEGIILVTGPTGSGKTTTLYSILTHVSTEAVNIMTLEDPVEYPLPLIRQTSVNEVAKMDFAGGIRSLMRQDPDIILVGEIRDEDTAEMAFRAAMTGHQVFSTLHTNSALGAVPRLLDIGVLPDILAGNIIGIVAQRLIRKLCVKCRQAYVASEVECRLMGVPEDEAPTIFRPVGCEICEFQGYKGRASVMEILKMDPELDELVARRATQLELKTAARERGFRTIDEDGIRRVLDGTTSLDEVGRVVDLTGRVL